MKSRHAGAALLAAMLTVALVATFAAAALWQQWRSVEVEAAERARVQSAWVLTGALDWARLILREDARSSGSAAVDHLGEPWAVPLQEARLSSFLAADRSNTADTGPQVLEAFLSGQIVDMQSMLNVNSMVGTEKPFSFSDSGVRSFARLFELLGLPPSQLDILTSNLRQAVEASTGELVTSAAPLRPQELQQLAWLGLNQQTIAVLQPYVTVLPAITTVNLNTASAEVIYASLPSASMADAQRMVTERERSYFRNVADARNAIGASETAFAPAQGSVGVASNFFEIHSRLRLDQLFVEERALVQRGGGEVRILRRERGAPELVPAASASARR